MARPLRLGIKRAVVGFFQGAPLEVRDQGNLVLSLSYPSGMEAGNGLQFAVSTNATIGTWPVSTAVSGFLGANYQVHAANGEDPSAIVVDNTAGTTIGTWPTSTSVSGFFGSNYQVHAAGTGGDSFTWTPTIPATGTYLVYARWTQHPNRSTHAVYTVNHAGGATPVTVNQEQGGGTWQLLGTFTLNAGSSHSVVLALQDDGYVIADAIKVVPQGAPPNTATWTPTVPTAKAYHVYARWTAHPNRATDAQYTVSHGKNRKNREK